MHIETELGLQPYQSTKLWLKFVRKDAREGESVFRDSKIKVKYEHNGLAGGIITHCSFCTKRLKKGHVSRCGAKLVVSDDIPRRENDNK